MAKKFQFKGKDIDAAVNKACVRFDVGRDDLDITILSTGSTGIFGLLKKQASIEACLKAETAVEPVPVEPVPVESILVEEKAPQVGDRPVSVKKDVKKEKNKKKVIVQEVEHEAVEPPDVEALAVQPVQVDESVEDQKETSKKSRPRYRPPQHDPVPVPEEFHAGLKDELSKLLKLMGMTAEITFFEENGKTKLDIKADELIGPLIARDGQALDGLQYLLRKITSQILPENGMFVVDIDGFRARRRCELQDLAISLSEEAKEKNVTRTIPPLNPSERRIVHMHLQDDTSIRSRSVGSGLFKKILIYKPGSRKRSGRKRSNRPRGGKGQRQNRNGNK